MPSRSLVPQASRLGTIWCFVNDHTYLGGLHAWQRNQSKVSARDYDIFAGLDVDKKHIDATFTDHAHLMKSMKISYAADHLISYCRRHFPDQRIALAYEAGGTERVGKEPDLDRRLGLIRPGDHRVSCR